MNQRGFTIAEALIAIVLIAIAMIGTMTFFASGFGSVNELSNRRAAMELARARMEDMLAADISDIAPPNGNGAPHWLTCTGDPCAWTHGPTQTQETVNLQELNALPMETTIQWRDDTGQANPNPATLDTMEITVRVWFRGSNSDDNRNRIMLRSLRTP